MNSEEGIFTAEAIKKRWKMRKNTFGGVYESA